MATPLDWPEAPGPRVPPTTAASPAEWPYAKTAPRATLRPVDPATGNYTGPRAAPTAPTAPPAPASTIGANLPPNAGPAPGAPQLDPTKNIVKQPGKLSQLGSKAAGVLGTVAAGAAMLDATRGSMEEDSTARYAKRFGMDEPTGDGSVGDIAKFATLRGLGYASDLGNNLTFGLAGKHLYRDMQDGSSPPTSFTTSDKTSASTPAAAMTPEAGPTVAAPAQPTYTPEPITIRDLSKGNYMATVPAGSNVNQFGFVTANPPTAEQQAGVEARIKAQGGGQDGYGNYLTPEAMQMRQLRLSGGKTASGFDPNSPLTGAQQFQYNQEVAQANAINAGTLAGIREREAQRAAKGAEVDLAMKPGESRSAYATRVGAMTSMRGQDFDERKSLRSDGTTRRGQDMTYDSTTRGQDMDLQGRIIPKQMEMQYNAQMRGLRAQIFKESGGDPMKAGQLALAYGLDGDKFFDAAKGQQEYGTKAEEQGRNIFKNLFDTPTGKDGAVVSRPDLEAGAFQRLMQLSGGKFTSLPKTQQDALRTQAIAEVRELDQANQKRGGGLLQAVGIDDPPPEFSNLPSAADRKNATLRQAGFTEWANPFNPTRKGDWVEEMPYGRQYRYGPLNEERIKERLQQGAQLK